MICMLAITMIAGCGSSGHGAKLGGNAVSGNYNVKWGAFPQMQARVSKGLTPLFFSFSAMDPVDSNGVTQADWERRAARTGMSVSDLKAVVFGGSAYKGPDGELRVCTISAIQRGLCGKKLGLSVEQRAEIAKSIIDQSSVCRWVGFDPGYNRLTSYQLGAEEFTLHVAADCG